MPKDHDYTSGRDISGQYRLNAEIKIGEKAVYDQILKYTDNKGGKEASTNNRIWYCTYRDCNFEGWVLGDKEIGGKIRNRYCFNFCAITAPTWSSLI